MTKFEKAIREILREEIRKLVAEEMDLLRREIIRVAKNQIEDAKCGELAAPKQKLSDDDSIRSLDLSVRTLNCLQNADLLTIGQVCAKRPSELLKHRNFGKKSLLELRSALLFHGRRLSETMP